ncbi:spore coat polysaccharide biosynthesis protein F, CMP-KDO synthetase [Desulfosporosinus orientis DSM 765]|uniref:Spore coat polysaccharide biosynthesis protein F, CMP-KDO synthetase n=1 Tax=Desulfosporosinus orientis (strain ATCC 19365 / DSM 765 / NCIMB 8382 / VKM B-1628 / Singapore I) TaxID=768706 RepID=G7WI10_DESOD|nr:glycosyltransferase family protein [Desulfosporosinus orientis]AET70307.1 spore coat polysaccharide biosynthesis protein F, CMP-KDO synthetase [Desulfosporosinus orientis DSM 765]
MKTAAIIQARMGSTRLPGKILKDLMGKTVLQHVIERVQQAKNIDEIIIATTTLAQDDVVADEALKCGANYFRGSENDVLARYYGAAKENNVDIVVRITSDCPLIDPFVTDEIIRYFKQDNMYDIVTNAGSDLSKRTFPRGLDTEVFSFQSLERAYQQADKDYQHEHVTPYIYENSSRIYYYRNSVDYSMFRLTLDTEEDFILIKEIYRHLYRGQHDFYLKDIVSLFKEYPDLIKINAHIEQKKL